MPRYCLIQDINLLTVELKKEDVLLFSDVIFAINSTTRLIEGINETSDYSIVITSNSSVRWRSSKVFSFRKHVIISCYIIL